MTAPVDVLVPTYRRPGALPVTLAGLLGQTVAGMRIVVSSQTPPDEPVLSAEAESVVRVLRVAGHTVEIVRHLPRRGMAEHRQSLVDRATAPYALFLDDDVLLEPTLVERLLRAIRRERCGFVGSGLVGLSYVGDVRRHQEAIEFWDGPVRPERVEPGSPEWSRASIHSAANLHHARERLRPMEDRLYRVSWVGGCVMYDTAKLRAAGGFEFWSSLPDEHVGEDVLAEIRVMERFGGAGLFPSGAYHLELPTTFPDRTHDAPWLLAAVGSA